MSSRPTPETAGVAVVEFAVAKLRLEPGDVLLVRCPADFTAEMCRHVSEQVEFALADVGLDNRVLVTGSDFEFSVVPKP